MVKVREGKMYVGVVQMVPYHATKFKSTLIFAPGHTSEP